MRVHPIAIDSPSKGIVSRCQHQNHTVDISGACRYKKDMSTNEPPPDMPVRKSVTLPKSMWDDIADFRFSQRIATEAEAVRRLIQTALKKGRKRD